MRRTSWHREQSALLPDGRGILARPQVAGLVAALGLILLGVGACGGKVAATSGGAAPTAASFCVDLAHLVCAPIGVCCGGAVSDDACVSGYSAQCLRDLHPTGADAFDSDAATQCLALVSMSFGQCSRLTADDNAALADLDGSCGNVFRGPRSLGSACLVTSQCALVGGASTRCLDTTGATCVQVVLAEAGAPCAGATRCVAGSACRGLSTPVCMLRLAVGEACSVSLDAPLCVLGGYCDVRTNRCAPIMAGHIAA
jgi:hypothetical protein